MSIRQMILNRFRVKYLAGNNDFINGGKIELYIAENGHKGGTASRELRLMQEDDLLEKEYRPMVNSKTQSVWYRYKPNDRELLAYEYRYGKTTNQSAI